VRIHFVYQKANKYKSRLEAVIEAANQLDIEVVHYKEGFEFRPDLHLGKEDIVFRENYR
jgi:hypothetical protein